jgi:hypothetical protein
MQISKLAAQLRKRLADKRLADTSLLQRMPDEAIIDAYINVRRLRETAGR